MLLDTSNHCVGAISLGRGKLIIRLLDMSKTRNNSLDMSNNCVGALFSGGTNPGLLDMSKVSRVLMVSIVPKVALKIY